MLAVILSMKFVRPLKKMTAAASRLGEGDYSAKTDIRQNDEIGDLALTLDTLSERLDEASRESERLEQSRRDFISSISHELRTPVTVLRGSLEALKDKVIKDPKQVDEYHEQMLLEILALQRLVDDLLSLTKLQNPDFKMQMEDVNLSEVLSDVVRSMGTVARDKGISIEYSNPNDFLSYYGDYGRLRQMIMAVLDNAVKFSKPSSTVSVKVTCIHEECRVMVEDNGQGIEKEDLDRIFERFYRHKGAETFTGTGLGLSIVKEIADRHGIEIDVTSVPSERTVFTFIFKMRS
jgi:signal transduction histidine kinase